MGGIRYGWRRAWLPGLLIVVGCVLRVSGWLHLPGTGLYVDEVTSSYESWSLLTTGAESWGNAWPVYFSQQGGGQNVLYSYLNMPFMAVFGPTLVGARLLGLLLGIVTLPLLYCCVRRWYGRGVACIALGLLAVIPWHYMLSHWALESNILPFTSLLTLYVFSRAIQDDSRFATYLTGPLLALNLYAYGIACVPMGIFTVLTIVFFLQRLIRYPGRWLLSSVLGAVVALPFLLFLGKTYLHLHYPFEQALPFTLPNLIRNRLQDLRTYGESPLATSIHLIFFNGSNDHLANNSLTFGDPFPSVIPWAAVAWLVLQGMVYIRGVISEKHLHLPKVSPFGLLFISATSIWFLIPVVVNETNIFYLPAIVLAATMLHRIWVWTPKYLGRPILTLVVAAGAVYALVPAAVYYFNGTYAAYAKASYTDLGTALPAVKREAGTAPIYVTESLTFNYVYTLWTLHIPPQIFRAARPTYTDPDFANFVFKSRRIDQTKPYWYVLTARQDPHMLGSGCVRITHDRVIDNTWRIGACLPN